MPVPAGPSAKTQLVLAQRGQIAVLRGASGADHAALPSLDDAETVLRPLFARKEQPLICTFRNCSLDVAFARGLAHFDPLIKHFEDAARLFARFPGALDDDLVTVGVGGNAKRALDPGNVLIIVSEHDRGGGVIGKGDGDFGGLGFSGRRIQRGGSGGDAGWRRILRLQISSLPGLWLTI